MSIFLLIVSILLWMASIGSLFTRPFYSPALAFIGLFCFSFCNTDGVSWLPINNNMLISWLCITVVVMLATMLQSARVRSQVRGMGYLLGGAVVGLAVGLLGFTVASSISMLYGIMIIAVAVGVFFGFLLYSNTPAGRGVELSSGNFFTYLLAKGFPVAVTVMQIGLVFVLLIAGYTPDDAQI